MLLSTFVGTPANAFIHPNGTVDSQYEFYGPHADQMIFQMYNGDDAMFTALQQGQIDLVDEELTTAWHTTFSADPNITVVRSDSSNHDFFVIDFNQDPYQYVPMSVRAPYHNPVYTDTGNIPPISTNTFFRIGVSCLFDRATFNTFMGADGIPIYTPLPSYMGGWMWPEAYSYPYSRMLAEGNFTLGHIYQNKTTSLWHRYWDHNNNGAEDTGEAEAAVIVMTWRATEYRKKAGEMLYAELLAMNFTVPVGAYAAPPAKIGGPRTSGTNYQQVMLDKNYHITTLGWIHVGPDTDYLFDLYHVSGFWDAPDESCPNTADLNGTFLNRYVEMIRFNTTSVGAKASAWKFQEGFLAIAAQIPLYSSAAYSANRKWYSGGNAETIVTPDDGENQYRRVGGNSGGAKNEWLHFNVQSGFAANTWWGFGTNTWFSYLNSYPNGSLYGNGHMTIRYGWRSQLYPWDINPIYSGGYWDYIVKGAIYDTLGCRDPYDVSKWRGNLAATWSTGTWLDGTTTKSKVTVTLRHDAKWQDGIPVTAADLVFTLYEVLRLLPIMGYQPPWWWTTGGHVQSISQLDAYTVEILWDINSYVVESWTLEGFPIIPKHIWKPIITSGKLSGFSPDPNVIGSGPWRFKNFTPGVSLVMVANKPGSIVQTDRPGAVPITSPGYHAYLPLDMRAYGDGYGFRFKCTQGLSTPVTTDDKALVNLTFNYKNWHTGGSLDASRTVKVTGPNSTTLTVASGVIGPIAALDLSTETLPMTLWRGRTKVEVAVQITSAGPWQNVWFNTTFFIYVTRVEDITGSTFYDDMGLGSYAFKTELLTPDGKVDLKDIFTAGNAFGSKPGSSKWNSVADINHDYKIDLKDYFKITAAFNK